MAALALAVPGNLPATGQTPPAAPVPMALVISNSNYASLPKLPTCELSANLVASVLSRAGFKVIRQTNPSNARLGTAIASLGDDMAGAAESRSLVYICGYIAGFSDRVFLVPVEARLERDADVLSQGIVARLLMSSVAGPGAKAGLVLMDAATLPDQKSPPGFDSMLRPGDAAHGGLVVAALPVGEGQGPAPLASALADTLASGRLEVGEQLRVLRSQAAIARTLLFVRPPTQPSWLLGNPPDATASAGAPLSVAPAPPALEAKPASPSPSSASAPGPNAADRRRVQLGLQRLGYFKGRVNGVFGPDTIAAIRQFQKDSDSEITGRLTIKQTEQLLR